MTCIVKINDTEFNALTAITESEQMLGLMYRDWPPPVMVFPYTKAEFRRFWMKNTKSPLDIVFCKDNVITAILKGEPYSTKLIGPNDKSDLVIELPYGTCSKNSIFVGNSVSVKFSKESAAKFLLEIT